MAPAVPPVQAPPIPPAALRRIDPPKLCILGSGRAIEWDHGPIDPVKAAQKAHLDQRVQAVWDDCVKEFFGPGALPPGALTIDFGRQSISYEDVQGKMRVVNLKEEAPASNPAHVELNRIRKEMEYVWNDMQGIWKSLKRPLVVGVPRERCTPLEGLRRISARQFLVPAHFGSAKGFGSDRAKANLAMDQILAGEVFVQHLKGEVAKKVKEQKKEIEKLEKYLSTPGVSQGQIAMWEKDLETARKLLLSRERFLEEVKDVDLYSFFWAVGAWAEEGPLPFVDFGLKTQVADRIAEGMTEALSTELLDPSKSQGFISRQVDKKIRDRKPIDAAKVEIYAREAGGFVFTDEAEGVLRVQQENNQDRATLVRQIKGPSMTGCIVSNMTDLGGQSFDEKGSLNAQGYQWGEDPGLVDALRVARKASSDALVKIQAFSQNLPWGDRVKALPKSF